MPRHRSRYAALCPTLSMVGCCSILHSSFFVILYSFLFILFSCMYTYVHVHVLPSYHLFIDIEKIVGHSLFRISPYLYTSLLSVLYVLAIFVLVVPMALPSGHNNSREI